MIDFLLTDYFYHLEILAVFVGTITYKWYKDKPVKYFFYFLLFTLLIETLGLLSAVVYFQPNSKIIILLEKYIAKEFIDENDWLYNIYRLLYFPFYYLFYKLLIKSGTIIKTINALLIVYIIFSVGDLIVNWNLFNSVFLKISRIVGTLFFLIIVCLYLFEIIKNYETQKFYLTLPFWITLGALFFNLVTGPIYIFSDFAHGESLIHEYFLKIIKISNYFMYSCFIIGFIINAYQENKKLSEVKTD